MISFIFGFTLGYITNALICTNTIHSKLMEISRLKESENEFKITNRELKKQINDLNKKLKLK